MSTPSSDKAAATAIIRGVLNAGWRLDRVNDGGDVIPVGTVEQALDAIFAVDMAHLILQHPSTDEIAWIWFVLGNSPEEVAADHTVNLSPAIDPITDKWWDR
jgi:hypothetical protein